MNETLWWRTPYICSLRTFMFNNKPLFTSLAPRVCNKSWNAKKHNHQRGVARTFAASCSQTWFTYLVFLAFPFMLSKWRYCDPLVAVFTICLWWLWQMITISFWCRSIGFGRNSGNWRLRLSMELFTCRLIYHVHRSFPPPDVGNAWCERSS